MRKSVGFGIVGCGMIGKFHLDCLKKTKNAHAAAIFSPIEGQAEAVANEYGITGYDDYDAFLAHPGLDAISLCTPSGARLELAQRAASAGKHVVTEKPIEVTLERSQQLIDACQNHGVKLACIFQYRFYPDVLRVKKLIEQGKFGTLSLVDAQVKWYRNDAYYSESSWRGTWAMDGGGALMNQGSHTADLLRYLLGEVAEVRAFAATRYHPIQTEDTVVSALRFESGAIGTLGASTAAAPGLPALIGIHGSQGSAILAGERLIYLSCPGEEPIHKMDEMDAINSGANPSDIRSHGHEIIFEDMANCILHDKTPLITGEDAYKSLSFIIDIYQSAGILKDKK